MSKLKSMVQSKLDKLFVKELGIISPDQIMIKERFVSSTTTDLISTNTHSSDYMYIDTEKLNALMSEESYLNR